MSGAETKTLVRIQDFVAGLRKLPEKSFDEIPAVRSFLRDHPVQPEGLAPDLASRSTASMNSSVTRTELLAFWKKMAE